MTEDTDVRERVVRDLFALLTERRFDELGSMLTSDAVFEVPYAGGEQPMATSREAFQRVFTDRFASMFDPFAYEITDVIPAADPSVIVVEYRSQGVIHPAGRPYANRYVGIFEVRGGRLARWREYHDPTQTAPPDAASTTGET